MRNAQLEEAAALPEEEKQKKEKKFSLKSEIISWLWTIGIEMCIRDRLTTAQKAAHTTVGMLFL